MPYITPQADTGDTIARVLHIPSDPLFVAAVSGALVELTRAWNWEQVSTEALTPDEAAALAQNMFDLYMESEGEMEDRIGQLAAFLIYEVPARYLRMDGATHDIADYPILASRLPVGWKTELQFTLPDMGTRTPAGYTPLDGAFAQYGNTGGELRHTLTVNEMPEHDHPTKPPTGSTIAFQAGAGVNGLGGGTGLVGVNGVGNRGGGQSHNNMPPFIVVQWAIVAK